MDHAKELRKLDELADWLDSRFQIPGTNIRFGLDSILGLVPGIGDGVAALPSIYVVLCAQRLGATPWLLTRMSFNVLLDVTIGAIPIVGDLFDLGFKANRRNVALLRQHIDAGRP